MPKVLGYTTMTVQINYPLPTLKKAWKEFFGEKKTPTKKEVAQWVAALAEADIEDSIR